MTDYDDSPVYDAPKQRGPGTKKELSALDAWDHVHRLFGVGSYSPADGLWWEYRRDQTMRLKSRMTRLSQTPADVIREADYCKAHGINIENASWVTKYYYEAKVWEKERDNERSRVSLEDRINAAVAEEIAFDSFSAWIDRLVLSQGPAREEVLTEWTQWSNQRKAARSSSSSPSRSSADRTA